MNKLNFIIDRFSDIELTTAILSNSIFSLSLKNASDLEKINLEAIHQPRYYSHRQFNFSLHIDLHSPGQDQSHFLSELLKNKGKLVQLIFHPNFKRINNKPLIFISVPGESQGALDDFVTHFETISRQQGFSGIEWIVSAPGQQSNFLVHTVKESPAFQDFYYRLLTEKQFIGNYLGIINSPGSTITEIVSGKKAAEEKFEKQLPDLFVFAKKYNLIHDEIPVLKEKLSKTEEDLANQKVYLKVMREEDEANKINNFYYYEYEILPGWYKKFGHLLKVITGKRSFRSLFDTNVKKYKA